MKNRHPPSTGRICQIRYIPIRWSVHDCGHWRASAARAFLETANATREGTDSATSTTVSTTRTGATALARSARYRNQPSRPSPAHTTPRITSADEARAK